MTPLLHPGYHKTGTTWMQKRLFIPEHGFAPVLDHADVDRLIFRPGPYFYDAGLVRALAEENHRKFGSDLIPVISSEIMSGQPFHGGRDCALIAERLKEAFPAAVILISIRNQLSLLPSLYMQYLQAGGTASHEGFFTGCRVVGKLGFDPDYYEFDRFVAHYARLFGAESLMVHPMELLQRDPKAIVCGLTKLTGREIDPEKIDYSPATFGASETVAPVLRRINHFRRNDFGQDPMIDFGRLGGAGYRSMVKMSRTRIWNNLVGKRKSVSAHVKDRFSERYAESNARLQRYLNEDLSKLGYSMLRP